MRLYSYQHPAILQTLQRGERHTCCWERVSGERWQNAFRWMADQMAQHGIKLGDYAPVWAWHSVNRIGGKPDEDCAHALLSDLQIEPGVVLLELEVPEHQALASCYNAWNLILDRFIDGDLPESQVVADCFSVRLTPQRGRPPARFPGIQACLPYIDASWVRSWELLDTEGMLAERKARCEAAKQFYEAYQSIEWEFDAKGKLLVKLTKK